MLRNTFTALISLTCFAAVIAVTPLALPPSLSAQTAATPSAPDTAPAQSDAAATDDAQPTEDDAAVSAVDLSSPQATVTTFLAGMRDAMLGRASGWSQVMATLDTSALTPDQDPQVLAEQLYEVLERIDARQQNLPNAALERRVPPITRYRLFPQPERHNWVWEQLGRAPDGAIWLEADEEGQWRFSAQTVARAGDLYTSVRDLPPTPTSDDELEMGQFLTIVGPTFEFTPWWGWAMLIVCIFIGLLIGKIVQTRLRAWSLAYEQRQFTFRATMFRDAANPANLIFITLGLAAGLFGFLFMESAIRSFFFDVIVFLLLVTLGWFLYNLVDMVELAVLSVRRKNATRLDAMIVPLIRRTLRIFLVIVFTLVVANNVFGLNIAGWLAGLGIAGLAILLAAQDSIKNLFGSMTVFFDKPFTVGDFITFDGVSGSVEEIGFRSTKLRLPTGHVVTIPNMKFIDNRVENVTMRPFIRREMNVTITYDTPAEKVTEAVEILRSILNDPEVVAMGEFNMEKNPPRIAFNELNADSLNIKAFYWYQLSGNPDRGLFTFMDHAQLVNMKLFAAYNEAGIEFAFPTQTLYVAGDPQRKLAIDVHKPE